MCVQEKKAASAPHEIRDGIDKASLTPQPVATNFFPHFLTPQMSARRSQYLPHSQSYSHPSTPRPRMGDACLALLEQTAIRPTPGSFSGGLGSHGSLQEKFLELCLPPTSVSPGSTIVLPAPTPTQETPVKVNMLLLRKSIHDL